MRPTLGVVLTCWASLGCRGSHASVPGHSVGVMQELSVTTPGPDVLVVIDTSPAMADKAPALHSFFSQLLPYLAASGDDFHFAVTSMDMQGCDEARLTQDGRCGRLLADGNGPAVLASEDFATPGAFSDAALARVMAVGSAGPSRARPLDAVLSAFGSTQKVGANRGFLRTENAWVSLVLFGAGGDCSGVGDDGDCTTAPDPTIFAQTLNSELGSVRVRSDWAVDCAAGDACCSGADGRVAAFGKAAARVSGAQSVCAPSFLYVSLPPHCPFTLPSGVDPSQVSVSRKRAGETAFSALPNLAAPIPADTPIGQDGWFLQTHYFFDRQSDADPTFVCLEGHARPHQGDVYHAFVLDSVSGF